MADLTKQYDVSSAQLKLLQERNARRNALRQEYLKLSGDPYKFGSGEVYTFDAAMARHDAARVKTYEYFRPTMKNAAIYYALAIIPISTVYWVLKTSRDKQEKLYRTGQVSYAERRCKFI